MRAWRGAAVLLFIGGSACVAGGAPAPGEGPAPLRSTPSPEQECDGEEGLGCPEGQYCAELETGRCPGIDVYGTCRTMPTVCDFVEAPVCGCDGTTYGNECQAAAAGVSVAHDGRCAPACGGFAALSCPGMGSCEEDLADSCDPEHQGYDCGGVCACNVTALCFEGNRWDDSPEVCDCVLE